MDKRTKFIIAGAVIAVLAAVVIYLNLPGGRAPDSASAEAAKAAAAEIEQASAATPPPAPPPPNIPSKAGVPRSN